MDIFFLLIGISIFLTGAAVFALDYFEKNRFLATVSFLVPPVGWFLYREDWEKAQIPAYTQLVGVGLIVAGVILINWFSDDSIEIVPKRYKPTYYGSYVNSKESLGDLVAAEKHSAWLHGRIHGYPFNYQSAEIDHAGTMRIKQGSDFYGELEINIMLQEFPKQEEGEWIRTIRPEGEKFYPIHISWLEPGNPVPQTQLFDSDYSLDLKLEYLVDNQFIAYLQLVLPDHEKSYVVGDFSVYSSRLRYIESQLDRDYDSIETIEVIASDTLKNTYRKYVQGIYGFRNTQIDYRSGSGTAEAEVYLDMKAGFAKKLIMGFYKSENGWFADVKGLKEKLKSTEGAVTALPSGLRSAQRFDLQKFVGGDVEPDEPDSILDAGEKGETVLKAETQKTEIAKNGVNEAAALAESKSAPAPKPADKPVFEELQIDVASATSEEIENKMKAYINKDVRVLTQEGKKKEGVYVGITRKQVVVEATVGVGQIEYLTAFENLKSVEVLNSPDTSPRKISFFKTVKQGTTFEEVPSSLQ